MIRRSVAGALLVTLAMAQVSALAQDVKRTPLPSDHPVVGTWKLDIPNVDCFEIYNIRADGVNSVTSGKEAGESEFEISVNPSERGFYKWVDKITKNNGQPDCMGSIIPIGDVATNYITLHSSGKMFMLCAQEDFNMCIGPFVRQEGI